MGADPDGEEIRQIFESKNLPADDVQTDGEHPTERAKTENRIRQLRQMDAVEIGK